MRGPIAEVLFSFSHRVLYVSIVSPRPSFSRVFSIQLGCVHGWTQVRCDFFLPPFGGHFPTSSFLKDIRRHHHHGFPWCTTFFRFSQRVNYLFNESHRGAISSFFKLIFRFSIFYFLFSLFIHFFSIEIDIESITTEKLPPFGGHFPTSSFLKDIRRHHHHHREGVFKTVLPFVTAYHTCQ